jgi:hypothetical protein
MSTTAESSRSLSFLHFFATLGDPCRASDRFFDLVFIALVATVTGSDDAHGIAQFASQRRDCLLKFCRLPIDPDTSQPLTPSHDTFERLLARLSSFARCVGRWTPGGDSKAIASPTQASSRQTDHCQETLQSRDECVFSEEVLQPAQPGKC